MSNTTELIHGWSDIVYNALVFSKNKVESKIRTSCFIAVKLLNFSIFSAGDHCWPPLWYRVVDNRTQQLSCRCRCLTLHIAAGDGYWLHVLGWFITHSHRHRPWPTPPHWTRPLFVVPDPSHIFYCLLSLTRSFHLPFLENMMTSCVWIVDDMPSSQGIWRVVRQQRNIRQYSCIKYCTLNNRYKFLGAFSRLLSIHVW